MASERVSRARARALEAAVDAAVDGVMIRRGSNVPRDPTEAVLARAQFLEGFSGVKVRDQFLRSTYVHLHELLADAGTEPVLLERDEEEWVADLLQAIEAL